MSHDNIIDATARRRSRRIIVQMLYQWHLTGDDLSKLLVQFLPEVEQKQADISYFNDVIDGVMTNIEEIDQAIVPHLSRPDQEITMVERAVLRLSVYELINRIDVPYKVVINEALELNKRYGTKEGHKFVNAVLDSMAAQYRSNESAG